MFSYPILPPGLPGQVLPCLVIDDQRVVIRPSLNQMEAFVVDPTLTEDPKRVAADFRVREAAEMRSQVQRLLAGNKAKRDNIAPYSRYIEGGMVKNEIFVTPPQTLIFTVPLALYAANSSPGAGTFLHIPPGARGTHADGETQYLARLAARNAHPETGDAPLAVVVDHSRTVEWGKQAFCDLNLLGVPISAAVAITADQRDPITQLAKQLADTVPALIGRVSYDTRQISPKRDAILAWWRQVFAALRPLMTHGTVLSLPVVLTAIGIAVHEARFNEEPVEVLLRLLEPVQWDRSSPEGAIRWAGVAGKLVDGKFSAGGGVKDSGYQTLEALTDPESDNYLKIRQY